MFESSYAVTAPRQSRLGLLRTLMAVAEARGRGVAGIRLLMAVAATLLLAGCADMAGQSAHVLIEREQFIDAPADAQARARVDVTDIRTNAQMERTALGASLGAIELSPPVTELVYALVRAKADAVIARLGIVHPEPVLCGIRVFDLRTPSTPIYWDINAEIEIVLRVRGQDRVLRAAATERTFLWPSEKLIGGVTVKALKQLGAEAEQALTVLFAGP